MATKIERVRAIGQAMKPDITDAQIGAMMAALAAGVAANDKRFDDDRIAPFENFWVGQTGVSHMGLHGVCAVKIGAGTRSAANCLVILKALVMIRLIEV